VALTLSIVIAAIPVVEQQFGISAPHQVSWRTAVDISRTLTDCREEWEASFADVPEKERITLARKIVARYRDKVRDVVDREMEVSLRPIDIPEKIGAP
jgi:hypothetical protein